MSDTGGTMGENGENADGTAGGTVPGPDGQGGAPSGAPRNDPWARYRFPGSPDSGEETPAQRDRRYRELPRTVLPSQDPGIRQGLAFDPALKHFTTAFRVAEPTFDDPAAAAPWHAARRAALDTVLAGVVEGGYRDALVLRGSALLAGWFGAAAREPGDLDFVVVPADWRIEEERTDRMLAGIASAAARVGARLPEGPSIHAAEARSEFIWTYERVPGRRMVLPWSAPGVPGGSVQLDFVFGEQLPDPPRPARVALSGAPGLPGTELLAASPELSLAWKLVWLGTDLHPEGKDLYDAVLLAERFPLRYELLQQVFWLLEETPGGSTLTLTLEDLEEAVGAYGWHHFAEEYPQLAQPEQRHFGERLLAAVRPVFGR